MQTEQPDDPTNGAPNPNSPWAQPRQELPPEEAAKLAETIKPGDDDAGGGVYAVAVSGEDLEKAARGGPEALMRLLAGAIEQATAEPVMLGLDHSQPPPAEVLELAAKIAGPLDKALASIVTPLVKNGKADMAYTLVEGLLLAAGKAHALTTMACLVSKGHPPTPQNVGANISLALSRLREHVLETVAREVPASEGCDCPHCRKLRAEKQAGEGG